MDGRLQQPDFDLVLVWNDDSLHLTSFVVLDLFS
jgi:hypothetical protein